MSSTPIWLEQSFGGILAARIVLPFGSAADPRGQAGLHQLLAGSLTRGCGSLGAAEFAETIESLGASLRSEANDDRLVLALKCVGSDAARLLPLLLEMVENPLLDHGQVELERDLNLQTLQRLQEDPFHLAHEGLRQLLYGGGGYSHDPLGCFNQLQSLQPAVLQQRAQQLPCRDAVLVVHGPADSALQTEIHGRLKAWQQPAEALPALLPPPDQPWRGIPVETEQTVLMLGFRTLAIHHSDALALRLLQVHLGVGMSSRLFQSLRETHGLVYDVGAELALRCLESPFIWHLSTAAEQAQAALDALLQEWQLLLDNPLSESDLALARAKLRGQEALGRQTGAQRAERMALCLSLGLPADYHQQAIQAIDAISPEAVQHAAQRWLLEPSLCACGPEDSLKALEKHWQHQRLRLVPSAAALRH